eukprot:2087060-Alexandrium_andersonii.AAC.1
MEDLRAMMSGTKIGDASSSKVHPWERDRRSREASEARKSVRFENEPNKPPGGGKGPQRKWRVDEQPWGRGALIGAKELLLRLED